MFSRRSGGLPRISSSMAYRTPILASTSVVVGDAVHNMDLVEFASGMCPARGFVDVFAMEVMKGGRCSAQICV
jgi:hypothetical protein